MNREDIVRHRLHNQQLASQRFVEPGSLVEWLGAMQAQEYPGGKWSIGLRLPASTDADIERAIEERRIVRTWPMRGTLHFVSPKTVRWMQRLLTPRVIRNSARRHAQLGLGSDDLGHAIDALGPALEGGVRLTRREALAVLERNGIVTANQRGYHLLWWVAQTGYICFGPARGRQPTFVLLDEWLPPVAEQPRDELLAGLATTYFTSHGPATLRDFMWWTGLTAADARASLDMAASGLHTEMADGTQLWMSHGLQSPEPTAAAIHLLPGFDEYILGYTDRSAMIDPEVARRMQPGANGMFKATVTCGGRVIGTWKRTLRRNAAVVTVTPFGRLTRRHSAGIRAAADRYATFMGVSEAIVES